MVPLLLFITVAIFRCCCTSFISDKKKFSHSISFTYRPCYGIAAPSVVYNPINLNERQRSEINYIESQCTVNGSHYSVYWFGFKWQFSFESIIKMRMIRKNEDLFLEEFYFLHFNFSIFWLFNVHNEICSYKSRTNLHVQRLFYTHISW